MDWMQDMPLDFDQEVGVVPEWDDLLYALDPDRAESWGADVVSLLQQRRTQVVRQMLESRKRGEISNWVFSLMSGRIARDFGDKKFDGHMAWRLGCCYAKHVSGYEQIFNEIKEEASLA